MKTQAGSKRTAKDQVDREAIHELHDRPTKRERRSITTGRNAVTPQVPDVAVAREGTSAGSEIIDSNDEESTSENDLQEVHPQKAERAETPEMELADGRSTPPPKTRTYRQCLWDADEHKGETTVYYCSAEPSCASTSYRPAKGGTVSGIEVKHVRGGNSRWGAQCFAKTVPLGWIVDHRDVLRGLTVSHHTITGQLTWEDVDDARAVLFAVGTLRWKAGHCGGPSGKGLVKKQS